MRFQFDEKKAAQAAAYLIALHGNRLNYTVLVKLLYLADRTALIEFGQPITGDQMVSMPHGAVLSMILDCINTGGLEPDSAWAAAISPPNGYDVLLLRDPGKSELSRYELELLDRINLAYGHMTWRQLRQLTHALPEYQDPRGSSLPIQPEVILRAEGKSPEEIQRIAQDAEEIWFIDQLRERAS